MIYLQATLPQHTQKLQQSSRSSNTMSAFPSTGSPELRGRASVPFAIHDEVDDNKSITVATRQDISVSHVPTFIHFECLDVNNNSGIEAQL